MIEHNEETLPASMAFETIRGVEINSCICHKVEGPMITEKGFVFEKDSALLISRSEDKIESVAINFSSTSKAQRMKLFLEMHKRKAAEQPAGTDYIFKNDKDRVNDIELAETLAISEDNRRKLDLDYDHDVAAMVSDLEIMVGNYFNDLVFGVIGGMVIGGCIAWLVFEGLK